MDVEEKPGKESGKSRAGTLGAKYKEFYGSGVEGE